MFKYVIISCAVLWILTYFAISFVNLEIDFSNWKQTDRELYVFVCLMEIAFAFAIEDYANKMEKK
jgi:hypothetical protein